LTGTHEDAAAGLTDLPPPRRRGRPPRRPDGMVEAAARVFAREGFHSATMEMIAAEARASSATVYKLFNSKAQLFEDVVRGRIDNLHARHARSVAAGSSPLRRLHAVFADQAVEGCDPINRGLVRAYIAEAGRDPDLRARYLQAVSDSVVSFASQLIEEAVADGELHPGNTGILAMTCTGTLDRFTLGWGLVMGDDALPPIPPSVIALEALRDLILRAGTDRGRALLASIEQEAA
jgi:AcrR family transcriptional regulator